MGAPDVVAGVVSTTGGDGTERSPLAGRIFEQLAGGDFHRALDEMVAAAFPDDRESQTRARVDAEREIEVLNGLVEDLGGPDFENDLFTTLVSWYMAINGNWQVINARLQAQMSTRGIADPVLLTKGGLLTGLLGIIAGELGPAQERLTGVLADFLFAGETVVARKRGLLVDARPGEISVQPKAVTGQFAGTLAQFLAAHQQLRDGLLQLGGGQRRNRELMDAMRGVSMLDESIVGLQTTLQSLTALPSTEALDALVIFARELADGAPFKAKASAAASPGHFPGEQWDTLVSTGQAALEHLIACAFDSREARMAAEKPAFLTIKLRLISGETEDRLEIEDDGLPPDGRAALPVTPLSTHLEATEKGTRYVIRVPHRAIERLQTYLVVASGAHRVALSISDVSMVVKRPRVHGGAVRWQDRLLPYRDLAAHLDASGAVANTPELCAVVRLGDGEEDRFVAVGIDSTEAVVSAFPQVVPNPLRASVVQGLIAEEAGDLSLVLDLQHAFGSLAVR